MNNILDNKYSIFGKLGDFWSKQLSEEQPYGKPLATNIAHLTNAGNAVDAMAVCAQKLTGTLQNYKNNYTIQFNPSNVVFTDTSDRPLYTVPIPVNVYPISISTPDRELTTGCSFSTSNGSISFYEDPDSLFPDNIIICRSAQVTENNIMQYTLKADNLYTKGTYIARYMRESQSPDSLQLALAEVAGLPIVHKDSIVTAIFDNTDNTVYELDTQVVVVPSYLSTITPDVGDALPAGTIFGEDYIQVYSAANTYYEPYWYRTPDLQAIWTVSGFPLNTLTPIPGIIVPDATETFSWFNPASFPSASGFSPGLLLSGLTGGNTAAYWTFTYAAQNDVNMGFTAAGYTGGSTANALDFYFQYMLSYNTMIIKLNTSALGDEVNQNVMAFIRRDLPINVTPVILSS